jgi:hypothetical protein
VTWVEPQGNLRRRVISIHFLVEVLVRGVVTCVVIGKEFLVDCGNLFCTVMLVGNAEVNASTEVQETASSLCVIEE